MGLTTDPKERKAIPIYSGFIAYFPDAIAAVAELSRKGNDQHNPGKPLHWDRSKSGDEMDAMMRHIVDQAGGAEVDTDDVLHATKAAWRAMANLQKICEARRRPVEPKKVADDGGAVWVPHDGREMPCDPGTLVEVRLRYGGGCEATSADGYNWRHGPLPNPYDIVEWRPAK